MQFNNFFLLENVYCLSVLDIPTVHEKLLFDQFLKIYLKYIFYQLICKCYKKGEKKKEEKENDTQLFFSKLGPLTI